MGQKYIIKGGDKTKMTQTPIEKVEFGTPFAGNASDKQLNTAELVRALRFSIAAEYEAIQLYTQLAEASTDKEAVKVLMDIVREEQVHAGELLAEVKRLDPNEAVAYKEGEEEIKSKVGKCISTLKEK